MIDAVRIANNTNNIMIILLLLILACSPQSGVGWSPSPAFTSRDSVERLRDDAHKPLYGSTLDEDTTTSSLTPSSPSSSSIFSEEDISNFCKGTNEFWKGLVIEPVRKFVEIREGGPESPTDVFSKLIAPPEVST
jgi:hypothetical protein